MKKLFTVHGHKDGTHSAPKDRKQREKDAAATQNGDHADSEKADKDS